MNGIRIPSDKRYLISKISRDKLSYDNSFTLMDFKLKNRKKRKSLVERGVVRFNIEKDCWAVGIYVYGRLVSLNFCTPEHKEVESIFDTVMAMEEHYGKE